MDDDRTASLMTPAKLAQVRQPRAPVSPAAWLDQLAADAGHQHLTRLKELSAQLQAQAGARGTEALAAALGALAAALPTLDFGLLQPKGLLARMTGKSRTAGAEFAAAYDRLEEAVQAAGAQVQAFGKRQQGDSATERTLVEFEVEYRAIDKIIDQGARWLQDMRNQLKARMAQATDAAGQQQVRDDAARCEILVARLKVLRACVNAAQQAHQAAQSTAARRHGLVQLLQQAWGSDVKAWQSRTAPLASAAAEGATGALNLEGPAEAHRELQLCIRQAQADCSQLQAQETALAGSLHALDVQLQQAA